jgi:hypothetical protein
MLLGSYSQKFKSKEVEEKVMTLGQKAVQQAVQQEAQATALRMLEKKFNIHFIAEVTHLSVAKVKQLAKNLN